MLIRNAEIWGRGVADLRITNGVITELGALTPIAGEEVLDAQRGALLPGLHDHHIHLSASAVRRQSVICGPPEVTTRDGLAARLAEVTGSGWIRGILYHESVAGLPDAAELDRIRADRPMRIQHRGGRMWLLNSAALDILLAECSPPGGMERVGGMFTGRLFDEDQWLRRRLQGQPPSFAAVSAELARFGVTGLTDMSPSNDKQTGSHFEQEAHSSRLLQRHLLAGTLGLGSGPAKLHLHENAMPDFDATVAFVRAAHDMGRPLASHCTTETEMVFTLAALEAAGAMVGDRIEHAGIANDEHIAQIAEMGLAVVSQPHFIAERGDDYLADVEPALVPALYRLASFLRADVTLAAGSDAPFGSLDPWNAMRAAVSRRTPLGQQIGDDEALTPDQALSLYLADPHDLTRQRRVEPGSPADLCLLDRGWSDARTRLNSADVRATFIGGNLVYQAPFERGSR